MLFAPRRARLPLWSFSPCSTILFHRWSGAEDLIVGTPTAGRIRPELAGLIGCFINPLPLRADLSGAPTFREFLARVKERVLAAFDHQDVPFEKIVEGIRPDRDLSREPLFQTMFVLQNAPLPALRLPGGPDLSPSPVETVSTRYDLTLFLTESAAGWTGSLEYNADLFRPETADRLVRHFQNLLTGALQGARRPDFGDPDDGRGGIRDGHAAVEPAAQRHRVVRRRPSAVREARRRRRPGGRPSSSRTASSRTASSMSGRKNRAGSGPPGRRPGEDHRPLPRARPSISRPPCWVC